MSELTKWHCVVTMRDSENKKHFWNITVDAYDAGDAADHALASYDLARVDGVEVERA
jgi:hypothetical protein